MAFVPVHGAEIDDGVSKINKAEAVAACYGVVAGGSVQSVGHCGCDALCGLGAVDSSLDKEAGDRTAVCGGFVDQWEGEGGSGVFGVRSNDFGMVWFVSDLEAGERALHSGTEGTHHNLKRCVFTMCTNIE